MFGDDAGAMHFRKDELRGMMGEDRNRVGGVG